MSKDLESFSSEFIDIVGELSGQFALSRIAGQIYGLLFISPEPLSLDSMTRRLRVSKGSVSMNIRELEKWGAVRKVWVKGSRKDYYQANLDTLNIMFNRLKVGFQIRLDEFISRIDNAENKIREERERDFQGKKQLEICRVRISKIKEMYGKLKEFIIILDRYVNNIKKLNDLQ